jgi:hypothetical protein
VDFFFGVQLSGTLPPCRAFNKNGIDDCFQFIFPERTGFVQILNRRHFSTGMHTDQGVNRGEELAGKTVRRVPGSISEV